MKKFLVIFVESVHVKWYATVSFVVFSFGADFQSEKPARIMFATGI